LEAYFVSPPNKIQIYGLPDIAQHPLSR